MGYHPLVSNKHLTIIFHASLSRAFFFRVYISFSHHSFTSSSHSLYGPPLFSLKLISWRYSFVHSTDLYCTLKGNHVYSRVLNLLMTSETQNKKDPAERG